MMHMMTSMPCKYNDIHAMTVLAVSSVYSLFWENHPSRQGCVVEALEGAAYVLSLVSSLISIFFNKNKKIIIMHFLGWMMTLYRIRQTYVWIRCLLVLWWRGCAPVFSLASSLDFFFLYINWVVIENVLLNPSWGQCWCNNYINKL